MEHRISRRKYRILATDFETHNDEESIAKRETGIWLAVLMDEKSDVKDESIYFYDMPSYLAKIEELSTLPVRDKVTHKRNIKNICIYDYNLSFEWSFILPYLLKMGFHYKDKFEKDDEFVYNTTSTRSVSSVWMIKLKFHKNSGIVIFRDLAKIFNGSLRNVAKSFNLPTQKGEIDYRKNRLHNYVVTDEEKEYCYKDVKIIMDILNIMNEKDDKEFWNSASSSTYSMKKLLKRGYPRAMRPYKCFRKEYPVLSQEETDFLRNSVGGGITYCPKLWMFKDIKDKIFHIDMHQAHPTSAYENFMPYGEGEYFKGKPTKFAMHSNCCRVRVSYSDVKLHSIIQLIGIDFVEGKEITIWDFEIPTMEKCYVDLEIEYIDGYCYRTKPLTWREYYADNYRNRAIAKANKDSFNTMYYKLLNNSSYGKLLEKPHNTIFANTINEEGIITSDIIEKPIEEQEIGAKYTYLPVGSSIPARTRVRLVETALLFGWDRVCYFDTDSIFIVMDENTLKVWDTINQNDFLGGWGLEEIIDRAQFTAPKRYKTEVEGHTTIKAGGINFTDFINKKAKENNIDPEKYEIPFEEVNITNSDWQVQRAYRVKGGTIIEFQTKAMSVQPKYESIYKHNILDIEC